MSMPFYLVGNDTDSFTLQLLHLHPLTLEDVLQQDPREKLDVFENLGYYLIVFRAIDETYFKYTAPEAGTATLSPNGFLPISKKNKKPAGTGKSGRKKGKLEIVEDNPGKEGLEGVGVGGINIYLVVFADGIVSVSEIGRAGFLCWG
jgi:magnesium transporter